MTRLPTPTLQHSNTPALQHSSTPATNWCEHGFEKGKCYRCDPKLEAKFKEAEDWCGGHKVPESQCAECNLDVET
ncbi:MAG: hypothetical protein O2857_03240, partial [Planctomycetota bacterium]|nr:hypothetical protein [Planctomycetota bacterium]